MSYLVYIHKSPCTKKVFYVGMGDRGRAYCEKGRNNDWHNVVNECYFDVEIIAKNLSRELALKIEGSLIDVYGIDNLVNRTSGGLGTSGYSHNDETKRIISEKIKGTKKTADQIKRAVETRRLINSQLYIHRSTGEIIQGLKWACEKYNINYRGEHQRLSRNSSNRTFDKL